MPPCADSTVNQCAPAESLMQASDIKCEPTCEPVTPTLMIQRNTNTRRQRKKTAENGKATIALPVSVKEESKCADVQRGTTRRNHSEKKQKGRAQRKRRNIEDNASEQMLNSGLTTESEPPSEAAPKQLDFPLTNIKTELDSSLTDNPRPRRDRKLPRKYTPAQPKDCLISYLKGLRVKNRCPKGVKTELMVDEATYAIILDEVLKAQDKHTKSQNKNPPVQIIANPDETLNAAIKEELISSRTNDIVVKESVSKKIKDTRKRKGKRAKKKVVASFVEFDEAAAPNPPVSSLNENLEQEVVVKRKGRCKRVKSELPALSAVENDKDTKLEPEDNVSVSCQTTESENCVVTYVRASRRHQGSQRLKSKENKKTSAGSLSAAHTPQTVEVVSDLKNVLMVSFEVDREAPTGHLKSGKKDMTKGRKERQTSKKKTFKGLRHLDSSEEQKPECDTRVLVNREMGVKSKIRSKRRKTKACTRFGKTSQIVKMENMFSCNEPVPACSSSIHDAAFDGVDLNTVKQEHNKSDVSELSPEEAPLSQDQPVHSDPPAAPEGKPKMKKIKKRRRRRKTRWAARKKLKRPQIIECSFPSDVEMSAFSFESSLCNSVSGDARISLTLEEESEDVKEKVTEQTQSDQADVMTANTKVKFSSKIKNYDPRSQKLKSQKPLKCSFCGRCFRHITAFTVHRRIHTGEKPYRCPTCGKNFARLYQLNLHSEIHNKSHAVCCPCCHAKFKNKDELILHFHSHMKDIQEDTTEEGAKHSQADSLDTPVGPSLNKPLRCSVCFKEFLKRATFKMHRRTRCGKPHTCSVCGKKFYQPSSLNVHEKTHWPVKPYSCTVCCRGFDKLQELKRHSQIHSGAAPFSCARCEKSFTTFALLRSHQMARACSDKEGRNRSDIDQFLVSQSAAGQIPTPVYLKCPICKQLHRHWCQYVLHLQTHTHSKSYTCETCRQQYDQAAEMRSHCLVCCRKSGEEEVCRASLGETWEEPENVPQDEDQMGQITALPQVETGEKEEVTYMGSPPPSPHDSNPSENDDFDISPPPPNSDGSDFCLTSDQASQQPSGHQSPIHRHCGRYSCGHCGKSFNRWNKLWLHRRFHRQTHRPFSCAQCDLEFRFLGSYIDHLQEHAAQMPYACPLCPDTFANNENLTVHISESHKLQDFNKCSKCGKNFSTLRNLKKHKLLHKGATSHFCLPCNLSFSSHSALKTHLKTHRVRLNVPQPAWAVEPLLFPYHCKRCTAKFSSTDLLQAHQVCHFTGGKKPESPTENVAAYIPNRIPENIQAVGSASSQQKRRLPVSNKKHLFRYPHPDRLYVVPVISSEPPVVISDTEEESPSIAASASSTVSDLPHRPGASFSCSDSNCSNIPQSSSRTSSSKNRDHSDKSLFLPGSHQHQFFDVSRASDSDSLFSEEEELVEETHYCAICMETFTDISKLHEHYMVHARGI
uniref:zinc finger protein Xfin n=1 Tax=Monopterus albus TaxID=43700 RepID=UPI0009B4B70D|nr:zinc finger protein Xfin-like [Monopterus albus]